jgi:hypothetical protein
LEADFQLKKIFTNPVVGAHTIRMQRWPRDLDLRKGLLSGYSRISRRPWNFAEK